MDNERNKSGSHDKGRTHNTSIIRTMRKRLVQFIGHICRRDGMEKRVLYGKIEGTKSGARIRSLMH